MGTVPTSYALNRALPQEFVAVFSTASGAAASVIESKAIGHRVLGDPRPTVTNYISRHELTEGTYPALSSLMQEISKQIKDYDKISEIPFAAVGNTRNDIYLASEAIRF